ncbi:ATP-grasp enzyme [Nocardioides dongxiaopingii]|uniref:ATP-grasp enzyme n=1 Tax=Nocardioides sp. S-1144 TaxID=2582905 RepID=UPI00116545EC|nr:ATP-grasp enzyme [Nocardioides sp. S-1144]QDH10932.1 ATP-grasp enzyme [Nocardioides sp. S-1144]
MSLAARARSVAAIAALEATLPLNLLLVAAAVLRRGPRPQAAATAGGGGRTVLVSGAKMTKALVLARLFHAAGHRVVLVETARYRLTGHRFSNAVDAFHVVPDPTSPDYAAALLRVVEEEGVDVWVPVSSPASSLPEAQAAELLAGRCEVVHLDTGTLRRVDDKHAFAEMAAEVGLAVPATHRITDPQQVLDFDFAAHPGPWVLKSIPYDPVRRLDLTPLPRPTPAATAAFVRDLPISPDQPWILQELLTGTEWCTHGTARDGRLLVWACCRSSAWQLTYEQVEHPAIRAWVERFVAAHRLTGQVSFDFMEDAGGTVRAIECNPRTHSAITLLAGRPDVAAAYLDDDADPVEPAAGTRPTYWVHHELWQAVRHPATARTRLRTIRRGTDAVLDGHDPWPFLALHHLHLPSLLLQNLRAGRPWLKIDVNIGKLVEPAGD